MDFSVIDIETTGANPDICRTCEIGFARFEGGAFKVAARTLVNPFKGIEIGATIVHDIGDRDVTASPDIKTAWGKIRPHLTTTALVFYNGLHFDVPVLEREVGKVFDGFAIFDPLVWVRWFFAGLSSKQLGSMCRIAGVVDNNDAHSAAGDCIKTGKLWCWLQNEGYVPTDVDEAMALQNVIGKAVALEREAFEGQLYWRRSDMVVCVGQGVHIGKPLTDLTQKQIKNLGIKKHATDAGKAVMRKAYKL